MPADRRNDPARLAVYTIYGIYYKRARPASLIKIMFNVNHL